MEQIKRIEYKVGDDIMKVIQNGIYDCYAGKVNFLGPDPAMKLQIYTGIAGMGEMNKSMKEMVINSGLVINASEIGGMSADNIDKFPITSYTIPFLANVTFILDPSLDTIVEGTQFMNGYNPQSYNYRIQDGEEILVEIVCIGKLPVFEDELLNLIRDSKIAEKYEMYPTKVVKYIMNSLKNLE